MSISGNTLLLGLTLVILVLLPNPSYASEPNVMMGTYALDCQGNYYDISYRVSNASVASLPTNSNDGLVMSIQNSSNGIISVYFPRQYMDQRMDGTDDRFIALTDGKMLSNSDIIDQSNSTHRILAINLPSGNFELEIPMSGTPESMAEHHKNCVVVPEFGTFALTIISISIVGMILIQKRFKF